MRILNYLQKNNLPSKKRRNLGLWICFLFFFLSTAYSQNTISPVQKYNQAGLVWGLMKYHHPEISNGKYDWDSIFIELFTKLDPINNQSEMNDLLLNFVGSYKTNKLKEKNANAEEGLFLKNKDYSWIDTTVFGEELTNSLLKLKNNTYINNYYASTDMLAKMLSFKNEKGFKNFDYNVRSHRLLLLYSFWNAMQYWNVNKYLTDEKWLSILDYLTSDFITCKTQFDFEMAKHKMISKLNDSHAAYGSAVIFDSIYKFIPFFRVKNINDSLVVNSIFNRENAIKENLALGDIITKIDDKNISTCIKDKLSNLISSSNPSYLKQYSYTMLYNTIDSIKVEILKKDGTKINKYIHLHKEQTTDRPSYLENIKKDKWFFIKPSIAYINLDKITTKELKGVFEQIANTEGLILDLRNYPRKISQYDIPTFTYSLERNYIKVLYPIENTPAIGKFDNAKLSNLIQESFIAGKKNSNNYKGKIVLLVNNTTQSHAELIGMAIQQSPRCITIGEQTGGAVRYVISYTMPDKTTADFTGLGAFYPNGEGVQRKGLHIDYYVKESATNYDPELYLKEAVKIIENK